ncbi:trypsin-like serine peptidase [Clavibacter sepedonicus]|nr:MULTISPECIES: serine protease [Clavibacter]MBD5380866.1 serine protease [Clavibacter sp.]OQJ47114.1 serine protease [Clavibacter sepedonicus]OQJ55301.1 serine protease [Clavibacter sepedonicus]UUK66655.1 serine protease [Clavibacter sepedonicus]
MTHASRTAARILARTLLRRPALAVVAGAAGLIALVAVSPTSSATADDAVPAPSTVTRSAAEAADAVAFWTPERLEGAGSPELTRVTGTPTSPDDTPSADELTTSAARDQRRAQPVIPVAQQVDPVSHIGIVAYVVDGKEFSCTGNAVESENGLTVATAGHCAFPGKDPSKMVFVPGYMKGQPYTVWPVTSVTLAAGWRETLDPSRDTAFLTVGSPDGRTLTEAVGASPVEFHQKLTHYTTIIGYPASGRFTGDAPFLCSGIARATHLEGQSGQELDCDMKEGASGAPLFDGSGPGARQYSVLSGGLEEKPLVVAPVWDRVIEAAYRTAQSRVG